MLSFDLGLWLNVLVGLAALLVMLTATEFMVRALTKTGEELGLPEAALGFLVALGSDGPEISTALAALITGSASVGVGVLEGSNIYNLAGLLGASAVIAGPLVLSRPQLAWGGPVNIVAALAVMALILSPESFPIRLSIGLLLLALLIFHASHQTRAWQRASVVAKSARQPLIAAGCVLIVIVTSLILVHVARLAISEGHIGLAVLSIVVLPVATSLPNTWAAVNLARRGLGTAVISTTLNSNLINLTLGAGLPSLFIKLSPEHAAAVFDGPFLVGMTAIAMALLFTSKRLSRWEGLTVIGLYGLYLGLRFSLF